MSLRLRKSDGKMSLKNKKDVPQLVKKYKQELPQLDRDLLRRLIRVENPTLFLKNPSNLKKLDRYLKKAFEQTATTKSPSDANLDNSHQPSFFDYLEPIDQLKEREKENKLRLIEKPDICKYLSLGQVLSNTYNPKFFWQVYQSR